MRCLKGLEAKVTDIDKRIGKLEMLDSRIDKFEEEIKKVWLHVSEQNKKISERLNSVEEKADATDFSLGLLNDKVLHLEGERNSLREEVVYLQSQSMRNNLIFGNIPEADQGEDTERVVRNFLVEKMKIAQSIVDEIQFERVHRMGYKQGIRPRKIVAKFNRFKEREHVRKQSKTLTGTDYFIHEQFPREVNDKRRKLMPQLKDARKAGKAAWLAYDTLYIDGKPVPQDK
jgi:DNA repair exonuclease SbcCD ATPase subunit